MAKKNDRDQDIQRLRDILYGDESKRIEDRLTIIEQQLGTLNKEIETVGEKSTREISELQVDAMDEAKLLKQQVIHLNNAMSSFVTIMKEDQQAMLTNVAKIADELRHSNAESSNKMIDLMREQQVTTSRQIEQMIQAMVESGSSHDASLLAFEEISAEVVHLNGDGQSSSSASS